MNTVNDLIVAVSHDLFDTFPYVLVDPYVFIYKLTLYILSGHTGNPNQNPVCKKKIKATCAWFLTVSSLSSI